MNLKIISFKAMRLIVIFCSSLFFLFSCKDFELKIINIELCENFSSNGFCKEKLEKSHIYSITVTGLKKIETWDDLGNYLYFHSRQTPGFIIRFNRNFTEKEKEIIKNSYKAEYEFYGFKNHVEGFEVGDDWIGSFQYLGSIIKDRQRQIKENKKFPKIENVFPAKIKFNFDSGIGHGEITTEVNLKIEHKEN